MLRRAIPNMNIQDQDPLALITLRSQSKARQVEMCFTIQSNLECPWTATKAQLNLDNPATTARANPPRPGAPLAKRASTVGLNIILRVYEHLSRSYAALNFLANLTLLLLNSLKTPQTKAPTNLRET